MVAAKDRGREKKELKLVTYNRCGCGGGGVRLLWVLSFHTAYHSYLIDLPCEAKQRKTGRQNDTFIWARVGCYVMEGQGLNQRPLWV